MTPKSFQNRLRDPPRARLKTEPERGILISVFGVPPGPKREAQRHPEIIKTSSGTLFFHCKIPREFRDLFFHVFSPFGAFRGGPDLQNVAKTMYCRSKSGVPPFSKKIRIFTKRSEKDAQSEPKGTPQIIKNAKNHTQNPTKNTREKNLQQTLKKKPVLAMEREARNK